MKEQQILLIGGAAAAALVLISRKTGTNPLTGQPLAKDLLTGKPIVRDPVTGKPKTTPTLSRAPTPGGSSSPTGVYTLPGGQQAPKQRYFGPPGGTRPPTTASASSGGFLSHLGSILGITGAGIGAAVGLRNLLGGRGSAQPAASHTGQGGGGASPSSGSGSGSPGNYNRQSPTAASPGTPTSGYSSTGYFDENGNWISPELQAQMDANPGGFINENGEYVPPTDAGVNDNPTDDPSFVGPENFTGPIEPPTPDDSPATDPGFVGPEDDPSWTPEPISDDDPAAEVLAGDDPLGSGDPTSGDLTGLDLALWEDGGGDAGGDWEYSNDVGWGDE